MCFHNIGGHNGFLAAIFLAHLGPLGPLMFWTLDTWIHQGIIPEKNQLSAFFFQVET